LIHYISHNQESINAVDRLREQSLPVKDLGTIEGNIDKILANRFKNSEMRWSISGILSLAKIGEMNINTNWIASRL